MSDRATAVHAPRGVEGTQRDLLGSPEPESVANYGKDWPLAAIVSAGAAALYALFGWLILVLVTGVSWQHLVGAGLLRLLLSFIPLFVFEVQELHRRQARDVAALLNRPASRSTRVRSFRLSSEDALDVVRLYAKKDEPRYEEAALCWLKRYIRDRFRHSSTLRRSPPASPHALAKSHRLHGSRFVWSQGPLFLRLTASMSCPTRR